MLADLLADCMSGNHKDIAAIGIITYYSPSAPTLVHARYMLIRCKICEERFGEPNERRDKALADARRHSVAELARNSKNEGFLKQEFSS
ncbi:MAG: hypothetical protein A2939_00790 [Parcubacteria group bacterium RIFCSPLOWO2_01_FULL_48_18]|nr:MAG: hypothetical protein A3J67_01590 [Parcubacteria group bacterium RIFCSPHIGHO2_02_FULL_48_10b]OHB22013.1 MAG: hypothetical protein A2939_00790 [Parcubacteria group bacterium RIFCSPLOWO2_01_FULL_48_18]